EVIEALPLPGAVEHRTQPFDEIRESGGGAGVELQGHRLAAQGLDFGHHALGVVGTAMVSDDDIATLAGNAQGGVPAEAAAGTGDKCDLAHGGSSWEG